MPQADPTPVDPLPDSPAGLVRRLIVAVRASVPDAAQWPALTETAVWALARYDWRPAAPLADLIAAMQLAASAGGLGVHRSTAYRRSDALTQRRIWVPDSAGSVSLAAADCVAPVRHNPPTMDHGSMGTMEMGNGDAHTLNGSMGVARTRQVGPTAGLVVATVGAMLDAAASPAQQLRRRDAMRDEIMAWLAGLGEHGTTEGTVGRVVDQAIAQGEHGLRMLAEARDATHQAHRRGGIHTTPGTYWRSCCERRGLWPRDGPRTAK